jgi:hypothetical protein
MCQYVGRDVIFSLYESVSFVIEYKSLSQHSKQIQRETFMQVIHFIRLNWIQMFHNIYGRRLQLFTVDRDVITYIHVFLNQRNQSSRSWIVEFLQKRKVGKAFSFWSAPKTGLAKYFAGLVSYDSLYRVTRWVYEK